MSKRALAHLQSDPVMARVIARIGAVKMRPRRLPPFQALVHAIIHQQLSGQAAATILRRFQALVGDGEFPSPAALADIDQDALRTAGLSRAKASYVKDVARRALDGWIPSLEECGRLSDAELLERLTAIKGVGRWTVEMLLIFNLGRPDVLPVHDLGVRRGYQIAYGKRSLPEPEQLERIGVKWSPHRTTAALYLWRAADFLREGQW
ncbi:MAG: DNA-3-methyladenine glycosylase [Kiritimatiellaeota bacterium]|nr:DNA-3-methyladenine glycosylase [Kiritimatiellota bacterium]